MARRADQRHRKRPVGRAIVGSVPVELVIGPPALAYWQPDWPEREAALRASWQLYRDAALDRAPVGSRPWA